MNHFVLDASAALRLFLEDGPMPAGLMDAIDKAKAGEVMFVVPELFWAETANVLHRRRKASLLKASELKKLWQDLQGIPAQSVRHSSYLPAAFDLAEKYRLNIYDALYLSVAHKMDIRLLTADGELHQAAAALNLSP